MQKLKIISIGKTKEIWLDLALKEYIKRLQKTVSIEFVFVKNDQQLLELAEKEPLLICLDAKGTQLTSEQFASYFQQCLEKGGSRLAFLIGGPEGLPNALKKHPHLISFSTMTFTHQLIRLFLLEQIYRAVEINKGSNYHK